MLRRKLNYYKLQQKNIEEAISSLEEVLGIEKVVEEKKSTPTDTAKKVVRKKAPKKKPIKRVAKNNKEAAEIRKAEAAEKKKIADNIKKAKEDNKGIPGDDLLGLTDEEKK